jgi:hypothetical protein
VSLRPQELDFVSDQLASGRRFRILAIFDDCTRECLAAVADAMLRILNNGTGRNFVTMHVFPETVLPRTFDFGATIDVELAIAQGEELARP